MRTASRTELIRLGYSNPTAALEDIAVIAELLSIDTDAVLAVIGNATADPDGAAAALRLIIERNPQLGETWHSELRMLRSGATLAGASVAFGEFLRRHPDRLEWIHERRHELPSRAQVFAAMQDAVADTTGDAAVTALRVGYRSVLAWIALYDLRLDDPAVSLHRIAGVLADLADATVETALQLARNEVASESPGFGKFPAAQVEQVRLAVIAMGKCGAQELNYVSDVDVMFVAEPQHGSELSGNQVANIATAIARQMMRIIEEPAVEPGLWEVDPNLRPEGRQGALVRTIDAYRRYYERWAENWEFQALLKARPMAGDAELGAEFIEVIEPLVWQASERDDFVLQVQAMRERVIANIPADEVQRELKLGPGGLRDIEFTVQLLQLVHGQNDPSLRVRSTLDALSGLVAQGFIGRDDGANFINDYRFLRLLEHRIQMRQLRRTHLLPVSEAELRIIARGARLGTAAQLQQELNEVRRRVRGLHQQVFYRPLLSAVAALPSESFQLTSEQAEVRLRASGYRDPQGALNHINALVKGVSRRATMQRHLLPVLIDWLGRGANPDQGLLAFRKLSEQNGEASWYLRLLRDSNLAARRLCALLSSSRFCAVFFELFPEAVRWLDSDDRLHPTNLEALEIEFSGALKRHRQANDLARIIRSMRRREVLRLAIGFILGINNIDQTAQGLTDIATATVRAADASARLLDENPHPNTEFAVIGMGRYGGSELGFGSDLDVMFVYRGSEDGDEQRWSQQHVHRMVELTMDPRLPLDLDAALRPEGKAGPLTRSLDAYRSYYERWSLSWEAQALLRANPVAGGPKLGDDFLAVAEPIRYRAGGLSASDLREIRRIKARVESERLPRGADPRRHLKLGRGSLSDVEWLVQTWQMNRAHDIPGLRTPSTLTALAVAEEAELVSREDAQVLRRAWLLASRIRSAVYLFANTQTDVLPTDPVELEGVARLLGYPAGSGMELENDYLEATRRSRQVFERLFYGDE